MTLASGMVGKYVVVRTYSAGVHIGVLAEHEKTEVVLKDARRIWSWAGANTLSEISLRGVGTGSRISDKVPEIYLSEAIELIPCSAEARENLDQGRWS
jgi:hypothetical protein